MADGTKTTTENAGTATVDTLARLEAATETHPTGGLRANAAAWAYYVAKSKRWCEGTLPCDVCDQTRMRGGKPCGDCNGTGFRLSTPRYPFPGGNDLLEAACSLADLIGDVEARGGLELLPERSREFVEQLRGGLGVVLMELVGKVQDLEEDLCQVPDERWPGGSYWAWRKQGRDELAAACGTTAAAAE